MSFFFGPGGFGGNGGFGGDSDDDGGAVLFFICIYNIVF